MTSRTDEMQMRGEKRAETAERAAENSANQAAAHARPEKHGTPGAKRARTDRSPSAPSGNDTRAPPNAPKNTTLPEDLSLAPCADGCVRLLTYNIVSLRSSEKKGLLRYLRAENADVVVLTETKVNEVPDVPELAKLYPHRHWGIGEKRGYAGIALLSKMTPLSVRLGLPGFNDPSSRARMVTAEFERTVLVGVYAVNAGEKLKTLDNKLAWYRALDAYLASLPRDKTTVVMGDLNVVLDDRDVSDASKKWDKAAGYTAAECDTNREILERHGLEDVWRKLHPDAVGHYTYYGFRGKSRERGTGWRLDSYMVRRACEGTDTGADQCLAAHQGMRNPGYRVRTQRPLPCGTCAHAR